MYFRHIFLSHLGLSIQTQRALPPFDPLARLDDVGKERAFYKKLRNDHCIQYTLKYENTFETADFYGIEITFETKDSCIATFFGLGSFYSFLHSFSVEFPSILEDNFLQRTFS